MSNQGWIPWLRDKIYSSDESNSSPVRSNILSPEELERKKSQLLLAQRLQLQQKRAEYEELQEELKKCAREGDQVRARHLLEEQEDLEQDMEELQGKIANQEYLQRTMDNAQQNRDQAEILKAGTYEMQSLVKSTEAIDIDDVVDKYQETSRITSEHSKRLAKPMRTNKSSLRKRNENVNAKLDALMQRASEEKTLDMPSTNNAKEFVKEENASTRREDFVKM